MSLKFVVKSDRAPDTHVWEIDNLGVGSNRIDPEVAGRDCRTSLSAPISGSLSLEIVSLHFETSLSWIHKNTKINRDL